MDRIALVHDLTNNPTSVQAQRSFIISGYYPQDQRTREILKSTNQEYARVATALDKVLAEIAAEEDSTPVAEPPQPASQSQDAARATLRTTAISRALLRDAQARVFWRRKP